jgi:hypothetical protein
VSPTLPDLAFPLVDVDANMIHGWPLLSAALTAGVLLWGRVGHHVKREASRFIPSTLCSRAGGQADDRAFEGTILWIVFPIVSFL